MQEKCLLSVEIMAGRGFSDCICCSVQVKQEAGAGRSNWTTCV